MNNLLHKTGVSLYFLASFLMISASMSSYNRCSFFLIRVFFFMYISSKLTTKYKLLSIKSRTLLSQTSVKMGSLAISLRNLLSSSSLSY